MYKLKRKENKCTIRSLGILQNRVHKHGHIGTVQANIKYATNSISFNCRQIQLCVLTDKSRLTQHNRELQHRMHGKHTT